MAHHEGPKFLFWILVIYALLIVLFAFSPDHSLFLGNLGVWVFLFLFWFVRAAGSH